MDTSENAKDSVKFRVLFNYDSARKRHINYLILMNERLFVVKRRDGQSRSELSMRDCFDHVIDFKVNDEESTGHPVVVIYKLDGSTETVKYTSTNMSPDFPESEDAISHKTRVLTHHLLIQRAFNQRLLQGILDKTKFGPIHDDNEPKAETLLRYGDVWKRIHNDQLVIGIPLLNASSR